MTTYSEIICDAGYHEEKVYTVFKYSAISSTHRERSEMAGNRKGGKERGRKGVRYREEKGRKRRRGMERDGSKWEGGVEGRTWRGDRRKKNLRFDSAIGRS